MNIALPDKLRRWAEHQADAHGYGTVSKYVTALIREDQKRKALDQKLIDAIESSDTSEMTSNDWNYIRSTVRQRLNGKSRAKK